MEIEIRLEMPEDYPGDTNVDRFRRQVRAELDRIQSHYQYDEAPASVSLLGAGEAVAWTLTHFEEVSDAPLKIARLVQALSIATTALLPATNQKQDTKAPKLVFEIHATDAGGRRQRKVTDRLLPLSNAEILALAEDIKRTVSDEAPGS